MISNLGREIEPFHVMELVKMADALQSQGKSIIHLSIGEPDFPLPDPVAKALSQAIEQGQTRYTAALGLPALRQAISDYYSDQFQVDVPAQCIVITSGASAALLYACLALVQPGQQVLLPDPTYPCNKTFVQTAGGQPHLVHTRADKGFQPDWASLQASWGENTAGAMIASPSNPTGTQIPLGGLNDIVAGCKRQGGFLIVDEIYQALCYDSPAQSVLQARAAQADACTLVVVNSFSKYFGMTGLRLGWMVVPESLVSTIEKLAQNLSICPPSLSQYAALACFTPDCLAVCETRREVFKARRDFLLDALPKAGFEILCRPDSAFYVYVKAPFDSDAYCKALLNETGVCVVPGHDFSQLKGRDTLRFSYANSLDNLKEAVGRMMAFNTEKGLVKP